MQDIIAALISLFLLQPVQARIAQWYADAGLSPQAAAEAASCFARATPDILNRASRDPAWAAYHAFGYWTGMTTLAIIVSDVAPHCAAQQRADPMASLSATRI